MEVISRIGNTTRCTVIRTKTLQVQCRLDPIDAFVEDLEWEIDDDLIASINVSQDKRSCSITTNIIGFFTITCREERTQKTSSSKILVTQEETYAGLSVMAILSTIFGAMFSFAIPAMASVTGSFMGGVILGLLLDFPLSASVIICLIGQNKAGDKIKTFKKCLTVDFIVIGIMMVIALGVA
jgi:hypothetical protein